MFTELPLGCQSSRHNNLSTYQVSCPTCGFVCQLHAHACPLYDVLLDVCCCFHEMNCFKHDVVRQHTELHLSTNFHVCAAVSELRESNQNKKEEEKNSGIGYFQFNTFPGYIFHPFFNQRYLLSTYMHSMC